MPPLEEMHHRLRNYSLLKESLRAVMETTLGSGPDYLELEARYTTCKCLLVCVMHAQYNGSACSC